MSGQKAPASSRHQHLVFRYCYRTVIKAVDERYDVRGSILAELVRSCLENRGRITLSQRDFYSRSVLQEAVTYLEFFTERLLFGPHGRLSPTEYRYLMKHSSGTTDKRIQIGSEDCDGGRP